MHESKPTMAYMLGRLLFLDQKDHSETGYVPSPPIKRRTTPVTTYSRGDTVPWEIIWTQTRTRPQVEFYI